MHSANGWKILSQRDTRKWVVPDTDRHLILAPGAAGFLLTHLALWFHETIELLDEGTWDDWGWAPRKIRGRTDVWSNHASGTAVDLNAVSHPMGVRNTYRDDQAWRIRARLGVFYDGAIAWGGDWKNTADEMHFELAGSSARVLALAHRLRHSPRGLRVAGANVRNAR